MTAKKARETERRKDIPSDSKNQQDLLPPSLFQTHFFPRLLLHFPVINSDFLADFLFVLAPSSSFISDNQLTSTTMATGKLYFLRSCPGLFYLHLLLIAVLVIFLVVRELVFHWEDSRFHRQKWYPPLLSSIVCGGASAFAWQSFTRRYPSTAMKAAFWLSPILTVAVSFLLISFGFPGSLAAGFLSLVFAVIQSLYGLWVNPRVDYSARIFSYSISSSSSSSSSTTSFVILSIFTGIVYASFLVAGIGEATAMGAVIDFVFILVILLSLAWTMQVIKNISHVTMGRIAFMKLMSGIDFKPPVALRNAIRHSMGSICIGSILVPVFGTIRDSARAVNLLGGDTDEFMFSCTHCFSNIASKLVMYGNRWGFILVGACNMGFVQSSGRTWDLFRRTGIVPVINYDLTSSFCFLSGVAVGAICTIVAGSWTLVIHKSYATEVSIYAFLIGYFIVRNLTPSLIIINKTWRQF